MHIIHQQFKQALKRVKGSICIAKNVHPESSDEEESTEPRSSKKMKAVIICIRFICCQNAFILFQSDRVFSDDDCAKLAY